MSTNIITLAAVSDPEPRSAAPTTFAQRLRAKVRFALYAWRERARRRRQARLTEMALAHLGPRELRDIGLVRLSDVHPIRYQRMNDLG